MKSEELKAAIEKIGALDELQVPYSDLDALSTVVALAEIGRLAVECNIKRMHGTESEWKQAQQARNLTTLDFIAKSMMEKH